MKFPQALSISKTPRAATARSKVFIEFFMSGLRSWMGERLSIKSNGRRLTKHDLAIQA
jgi:hypothetical protein